MVESKAIGHRDFKEPAVRLRKPLRRPENAHF
jgi:hypothetical protein